MLIYVGIAPKSPKKRDGTAATRTVADRLRYEVREYAQQSPIRAKLGCLLGLTPFSLLNRRGGRILHFKAMDDERLSVWLQRHAFTACHRHDHPWVYERELVGELRPLLNSDFKHRRVRHSARWAGAGGAAGETAGELLRAATVPRDVLPRHAGAAGRRDAICRPDGQGGREAYLRRRHDQQRRTALETGDEMKEQRVE